MVKLYFGYWTSMTGCPVPMPALILGAALNPEIANALLCQQQQWPSLFVRDCSVTPRSRSVCKQLCELLLSLSNTLNVSSHCKLL